MKKCFAVFLAVLLSLNLIGCNTYTKGSKDNVSERGPRVTGSDSIDDSETASVLESISENDEMYSSEKNSSQNKSESDTEKSYVSNTAVMQTVSKETSETSDTQNTDWLGVYIYDDGKFGEILTVSSVYNGTVSGVYVYNMSSGAYGVRDFSWTIDTNDFSVASEIFQNGVDKTYYHLKQDKITAEYPEGWWESRDYNYVCNVNETDKYIKHPYYPGQSETTDGDNIDTNYPSPFYGIWIGASKEKSECDIMAAEMQNKGFDAKVYETTDWSNLNTEHWYVVSAGEYPTETAANNALSAVQSMGHDDAYVKYTGDWKK